MKSNIIYISLHLLPRVSSMYYLYVNAPCVIFLHFDFDLSIFMTQTSQSDNFLELWKNHGQ